MLGKREHAEVMGLNDTQLGGSIKLLSHHCDVTCRLCSRALRVGAGNHGVRHPVRGLQGAEAVSADEERHCPRHEPGALP